MRKDIVKLQEHNLIEIKNTLEEFIPLMNNTQTLCNQKGKKIKGVFDDCSLKRTYLKNKTIYLSSFNNSALTNSQFYLTKLYNNIFDESNMQYCKFIKCKFKETKIISTNLSYSVFSETIFENVLFKGSTVSELMFDKCVFKDCIFTSSMLENAVFSQCIMDNVEFIDTNIEYMIMASCNIQKTYVPLSQIPYVFGIFEYFEKEQVIAMSNNGPISYREYLDLQNNLLTYYDSVAEYFPIVNILTHNNKYTSAYENMVKGIKKAIKQKDFRMLKFYCKLAVQNDFWDYNKRRELFNLIEKNTKKQNLNIFQQRDFIYNYAEIRYILLDSIYNNPTARIVFQTNIDSKESDKVIEFIGYVDSVIRTLCSKQSSYIEYRHNSDVEITAFLSANFFEILLVLSLFLKVANNTTKIIQERILAAQQITLNKLEIEKKKNEIEQTKLEKSGDKLKEKGISFSIKYYINNTQNEESNINFY